VAAILEDDSEPGRTIDSVLSDLFYGGCASCTISDMVYYREYPPVLRKNIRGKSTSSLVECKNIRNRLAGLAD